MKTRFFTLHITILMMVAAMTAAGQPARGERNGNHEKNNRKETVTPTRNEIRGNQNIRIENDRNDRVSLQEDITKSKKMETGRSTDFQERQAIHPENREKHYGKAVKPENRNGLAEQRGYQESFAHNRSGNYWEHRNNRNFNRHDWEHRTYRWSDHNWRFSNYYRQGYIPWYFRDNRSYWYYPGYGHILRGFRNEPLVLYSGMTRIYYADGFFYRLYPGIGYVWIEEPYDIWFSEIPYHMVSIRFHGKNYFRLGNTYFTTGRKGFRLAVLPDRYYDPRFNGGPFIGITARF